MARDSSSLCEGERWTAALSPWRGRPRLGIPDGAGQGLTSGGKAGRGPVSSGWHGENASIPEDTIPRSEDTGTSGHRFCSISALFIGPIWFERSCKLIQRHLKLND